MKKVVEILSELLGVPESQCTPDAHLRADLMADSLDEVQIVMALEEQFGVTVPDEMSERVTTVGSLVQLLADVLDGKKATA